MKKEILVLAFLGCSLSVLTQSFENGDLDGAIGGLSDLPNSWEPVSNTDPLCNASSYYQASADLTNLSEPDSSTGVMGNPYSGSTFVSGIEGSSSVFYWHEGIQQTVAGLTPGETYDIGFYQTVVKQLSFRDTSGSWAVCVDSALLAISVPSISNLPFNSTDLQWEFRTVPFTATSDTHTFKFLPFDDDSVNQHSQTDLNGGLRMGIDNINLSISTTYLKEERIPSFSVFPNPVANALFIDLKQIYQSIEVEVYNCMGKLVETKNFKNSKDLEIHLNFVGGIYFLTIKADDELIQSIKVVKV